jgi:flagellar biosynthesis/type III secretory pathway protein FliH
MNNVLDLVKAGEYIKAIKLHREQTGLGLKESKKHIDELRMQQSLSYNDIDKMKDHIQGMYFIDEKQRNFILDLVEEAYYLGEDNGDTTGYNRSLNENEGTADYDEDDVYERAYDEGWQEGRSEGHEDGQREGYEQGMEEKSEQSYNDGVEDGKNEGYEDGKNEGYEEGYDIGKLEGYEGGHQTGLEQGRAEERFERSG